MPTSANSKNPKRPTPRLPASSATSTLTGEPVNTNNAPACAENAIGINSFDGSRPSRIATRTVIGGSAATAPLGVRIAERPAASSKT